MGKRFPSRWLGQAYVSGIVVAKKKTLCLSKKVFWYVNIIYAKFWQWLSPTDWCNMNTYPTWHLQSLENMNSLWKFWVPVYLTNFPPKVPLFYPRLLKCAAGFLVISHSCLCWWKVDSILHLLTAEACNTKDNSNLYLAVNYVEVVFSQVWQVKVGKVWEYSETARP